MLLRLKNASLQSRELGESKNSKGKPVTWHQLQQSFSDSRNTWRQWQGIQTITDYKPTLQTMVTQSPDSVWRSLAKISTRKAPGPDNILGQALTDYAVELTNVFTDIFNTSLGSGRRSHMPQSLHHHYCTQEVIYLLL